MIQCLSDASERIVEAWGWFERAAPEMLDDEREVYLRTLGVAYDHHRAGRADAHDAALDRLREFATSIIQPRMRAERDNTRDEEGLTEWERRTEPPEAVEIEGVPMRAALLWERRMFNGSDRGANENGDPELSSVDDQVAGATPG